MKIACRFIALFFVCIAILLQGCSVQLISAYDEETDKATTALHKNFETFFVKEQKQIEPDCRYENNLAFYQQAKIDLASLKLRVSAIPKNKPTIDAVDDIEIILTRLETIHQGREKQANKCLEPKSLKGDQIATNSAFGAILKLELEKKRGKQ